MPVLVKLHVAVDEKVAVSDAVLPFAGNCTPVKVCEVLLPSEPTATVALPDPDNTKLPVVGGVE
jgi:hypothetical protein